MAEILYYNGFIMSCNTWQRKIVFMHSSNKRSKFEEEHCRYIEKLTNGQVKVLTEHVKRYLFANGIVFKNRGDSSVCSHIPITLFPSPFPLEQLKLIQSIQPDINLMLHRISLDYEFLYEHLKSVRKADKFVKKLVKVLKSVDRSPFKQTFYAGIIRTDYMVDESIHSVHTNPRAFLVEYNTISVSFGAHGGQMGQIHKEVIQQATNIVSRPPNFVTYNSKNNIAEDIGLTLSTSWIEYFKRYSPARSCILFIIQENERNIFDHSKVEHFVCSQLMTFQDRRGKFVEHPPIFYATLNELHDKIRIIDKVGSLLYKQPGINDEFEIAVAYFRAGYTPDDYASEDCWNTRTMLETNRAIKIPSIGLQLAGLKTIQQKLLDQKIIQRFLLEENAKRISDTFTGTFALDHPDKQFLDRIMSKIKKNPELFVLKPQREGGGNNIYGEDIIKELESLISESKPLSGYILMSFINAPTYKNYFVLPDHEEAILFDSKNEIGQFGMFLADDSKPLFNMASGCIMRSKSAEEPDGGVASGRAVLDSVCLY